MFFAFVVTSTYLEIIFLIFCFCFCFFGTNNNSCYCSGRNLLLFSLLNACVCVIVLVGFLMYLGASLCHLAAHPTNREVTVKLFKLVACVCVVCGSFIDFRQCQVGNLTNFSTYKQLKCA